jgi:hypothetical protein
MVAASECSVTVAEVNYRGAIAALLKERGEMTGMTTILRDSYEHLMAGWSEWKKKAPGRSAGASL